jgi:type IV secretory pathway VirB2 component (pilin)
MSMMEPEVKDFLKKIVQSVFTGLLWMMINMIAGIYFGWMFIYDKISVGNIIFYVFLIVSLLWLIRFYYRTWKNKFPHG